MYVLTGILGDPSFLFAAAINAICAFCLGRYKSRVAAIALLILISLGIVARLTNGFSADIIVSALLLPLVIRATQATIKLHGVYAAPRID